MQNIRKDKSSMGISDDVKVNKFILIIFLLLCVVSVPIFFDAMVSSDKIEYPFSTLFPGAGHVWVVSLFYLYPVLILLFRESGQSFTRLFMFGVAILFYNLIVALILTFFWSLLKMLRKT